MSLLVVNLATAAIRAVGLVCLNVHLPGPDIQLGVLEPSLNKLPSPLPKKSKKTKTKQQLSTQAARCESRSDVDVHYRPHPHPRGWEWWWWWGVLLVSANANAFTGTIKKSIAQLLKVSAYTWGKR